MRKRLGMLLSVVLLLCVVQGMASANSAPPRRLGDKSGMLLPGVSSQVHIKREQLTFDLAPEYGHAQVTARYEMENRGAALSSYPVIFVMQTTAKSAETVQVSWNGSPLTVKAIRPTDLSAAEQKEMESAWTAMDQIVDPTTQAPGSTKDFFGSSTLQFAQFELNVPAGASGQLDVKYSHTAVYDDRGSVNPRYHYQYLLLPAKAWASFGPLDITIKVPGKKPYFASSLQGFTYANGEFKASFPGLPEQNLAFGVMSTKGVWFGMTEESGYLGLGFIVQVLLAVPVGMLTGRLAGRVKSKGWAIVLGILSGLLLGGLLNLVVTFSLSAATPALQGYNLLPLLFTFVLAELVTIVVAGMAAARRHKRKHFTMG